jgi:hypothetical protein
MKNFVTNFKITKVHAAEGAAAADHYSDVVDMAGWDGAVFLVSIGSAASNNGANLEQDTASGFGTDPQDLEGTKILSDGTQTDFVLEVYRPTDRYVRCQVIRGTSTTIEAIWCIQYRGRKMPVDNNGTYQAAEVHASPDEGTA